MEKQPDWNMRQTVSIKIVAQLKEMTEDEQRKFLVKLLEHMEAPFIIALNFAYELSPGAKRGSKAEQPYICATCGKSFTFPQVLFWQDRPYCFEHIPEYKGQDSQGW